MVVRTTCYYCVAQLHQGLSQSPAVGHHLALINSEFWSHGLLQGHSNPSNGVIVGTSLQAWEHGRVDERLQVVQNLFASFGIHTAYSSPVEDHAGPAASQGFVGGGGHHMAVFKRGGHHASHHQPANVRHVSHEVRPVVISNLPQARVVQVSGVAAGSCDNQLRVEEAGIFLQLVVVDVASVRVHLQE